jgi:hypothetical protein
LKPRPKQPDIDAIVEIGEDLDLEFRRQPGLYSWLSGHYVVAVDQTRRLKNSLALLRAQLADKARRQADPKRRLTKEEVENWVIQREPYQSALNQLLDAQLVEETLGEGLEALNHKRESLMNLAANMRREMTENIRDPIVRGVRRN